MFHRAFGAESANLDAFFLPENRLKSLFCHYASQKTAIIEAAMGFYDGSSSNDEKHSAYEISRALKCPVILTVDAAKAGRSILAEIAGFLHWKSDSAIAGVILNNIAASRAMELKAAIESELGIKMLGFLEKDARFSLESRHLGLAVPESVGDLNEKIDLLAKTAQKNFDLDEILKIARSAEEISVLDEPFFPDFLQNFAKNNAQKKRVKIAVAKDEAFCFYYRENLDLFSSLGAEIAEFSPLKDKKIPDGTDALYLGGGYPELFPSELFENDSMCLSVRNSVRGGLPTLAECGGFLYLQALGALSGTFQNTKKLCRFGYVELEAEKDTLLCSAGEKIKAHEFHYFDTTANGDSCSAKKPSGKKWQCVVSSPFDETPSLPPFSQTLNVWAGFPHLYFPSNPDFARNFVCAAEKFQKLRLIIRSKCDVCPKKRRQKGESDGK